MDQVPQLLNIREAANENLNIIGQYPLFLRLIENYDTIFNLVEEGEKC